MERERGREKERERKREREIEKKKEILFWDILHGLSIIQREQQIIIKIKIDTHLFVK